MLDVELLLVKDALRQGMTGRPAPSNVAPKSGLRVSPATFEVRERLEDPLGYLPCSTITEYAKGVGPDYYPSAAFVSIDTTSAAPSSIQIAGAGAAPEDGFSGYGPIAGCPTCSGDGVARWGDYSTAVADGDGTIWSISEYIPNAPRTPLANWGTFISRYVP